MMIREECLQDNTACGADAPIASANREHRTHRLALVLAHGALFALCGTLAFLLRFDFGVPRDLVPHLIAGVGTWLTVKLAVLHIASMDRGWARLLSTSDVARLVLLNAKASFIAAALIVVLGPPGFPRSIYLIDFSLAVLATIGIQLSLRLWADRASASRHAEGAQRTIIYGAGAAGELLLQDIQSNPRLPFDVVGFIDDNPAKSGMTIHGVRVIGTGKRFAECVRGQRAEQVLIALPSATGPEIVTVLRRCHEAGVACRTVPGLDEILRGSGLAKQVREVNVDDVLGRSPVKLDEVIIGHTLRDKVVLVTGAGGSIGSELCRQIARFEPRAIIGFEISENALYELDREMSEKYPDVRFIPSVGSIQNRRRLNEVMERHQPKILYHAAAYKHVPMMEDHVFEAVENNIFGTWNVVRAAAEFHVERFVLISSDKAVRPTNIMGATKRVAELVVNSMRSNGTKYVAVRFGNVLGSNGSVIPLFKRQIAAGGPVTVTHPDMQRYFMTIREAVQLVLQASAMGEGGEVFVLDMGRPVRIVDLARDLILLSGLRPGEDIQIEYSGVRPGEKLCEELSALNETTVATRHSKIRIFTGPGVGADEVAVNLEELRQDTSDRDALALVTRLQSIVPDYYPSWHVLESARKQSVPRATPLIQRKAWAAAG